jgi:hypothetical protein
MADNEDELVDYDEEEVSCTWLYLLLMSRGSGRKKCYDLEGSEGGALRVIGSSCPTLH